MLLPFQLFFSHVLSKWAKSLYAHTPGGPLHIPQLHWPSTANAPPHQPGTWLCPHLSLSVLLFSQVCYKGSLCTDCSGAAFQTTPKSIKMLPSFASKSMRFVDSLGQPVWVGLALFTHLMVCASLDRESSRRD